MPELVYVVSVLLPFATFHKSANNYIKIFAIIDVVFLLIQAITLIFRLVAVPLPICGYLAGRMYNTKFAYAYAFYQGLNIFTEAGLMFKGYNSWIFW